MITNDNGWMGVEIPLPLGGTAQFNKMPPADALPPGIYAPDTSGAADLRQTWAPGSGVDAGTAGAQARMYDFTHKVDHATGAATTTIKGKVSADNVADFSKHAGRLIGPQAQLEHPNPIYPLELTGGEIPLNTPSLTPPPTPLTNTRPMTGTLAGGPAPQPAPWAKVQPTWDQFNEQRRVTDQRNTGSPAQQAMNQRAAQLTAQGLEQQRTNQANQQSAAQQEAQARVGQAHTAGWNNQPFTPRTEQEAKVYNASNARYWQGQNDETKKAYEQLRAKVSAQQVELLKARLVTANLKNVDAQATQDFLSQNPGGQQEFTNPDGSKGVIRYANGKLLYHDFKGEKKPDTVASTMPLANGGQLLFLAGGGHVEVPPAKPTTKRTETNIEEKGKPTGRTRVTVTSEQGGAQPAAQPPADLLSAEAAAIKSGQTTFNYGGKTWNVRKQ